MYCVFTEALGHRNKLLRAIEHIHDHPTKQTAKSGELIVSFLIHISKIRFYWAKNKTQYLMSSECIKAEIFLLYCCQCCEYATNR